MEDTKRAPRRSHSAELKARVLGECSQQGASIAKVALAHGLNANLVHKWRRAAEAATTRFTALALPPQPAPLAPPDIRIELRRGATIMNIHWPAHGAGDCAAWLREWLR